MEMTHELHYFRQQHSSWLVEDGIILMGGKSKGGLHKNGGIFHASGLVPPSIEKYF